MNVFKIRLSKSVARNVLSGTIFPNNNYISLGHSEALYRDCDNIMGGYNNTKRALENVYEVLEMPNELNNKLFNKIVKLNKI